MARAPTLQWTLLLLALSPHPTRCVHFTYEISFSNDPLDPQISEPEARFLRAIPDYTIRPGDDPDQVIDELVRTANRYGLKFSVITDIGPLTEVASSRRSIHQSMIPPQHRLSHEARPAPIPFSFHRQYYGGTLVTFEDALVEHVRMSILSARRGMSNLVPDVLTMEGMSDKLVRHFMNNVASASGSRYLEIGTWRGSTLVSALCGNELAVDVAVAIDSWEDRDEDNPTAPSVEPWFAKGRENMQAAQDAVNRFVGPQKYLDVRLIRRDFRALDGEDSFEGYEKSEINVYLFDGPHEFQDHYDALALMLPRLANTFVYIVDDWNHLDVPRGTWAAVADLNLTVVWGEVLGGAGHYREGEKWHNGLYVAVMQKP